MPEHPDRPGGRARFQAMVHGRVQGVNFRSFTADHARRLGLSGTVRNLPDGRTVVVEAQGSRDALEQLLVLLRDGPRFAMVEYVDVTWLTAADDQPGFRVVP